MNRIADLTWKHPKLVLAVVALFTLLAAAVGRDVEQHLKAAGFTDSASESERAGALLRDGLGYDPNPGLVVVVRAPDGGQLDTPPPPCAAKSPVSAARSPGSNTSAGSSTRCAAPRQRQARRPRRRVADDPRLPLHRRHPGRGRDRRRGSPRDARLEPLDVALGGFAAGFNETNDQTREDLTKAELIAFPILALLLLFVFRGVVAAAIPLLLGVISIIGTLLVLRVMSSFADTSLFALNIATGLSLGLAVDYALLLVSRYREEIGRDGADAGGAPPHRAHRRADGGLLRPHRRRRDGGADRDAAALPLLDGGRRRLGGGPLSGDGDPRRPLPARAARHPHRRPLGPPRPRRLRCLRRLVPAGARGDAAPGGGRPRQLGAAAGRGGAAALDHAHRPQRRSGAPR